MAAMMDSLSDSFDISQLKRIALGFYDSDEDEDEEKNNGRVIGQISGRRSSVIGIAPSSLTAAARLNPNASSTNHPRNAPGRNSRPKINTRQDAPNENDRSYTRRVHSSPAVRIDSGVHPTDSRTPRTRIVRSDENLASLSRTIFDSQLPSTIPESTEKTRKRRKMEIYTGLTGGDTQPVSQWVYDEFTSNTRPQQPSVGERVQGLLETTSGLTPSTYRHGDSGHIDLLGAFEPQVVNDLGEGSDGGSGDNESSSDISQINVDVGLTPELKRCPQPKTPATNSKKRSHSGQILNPPSTPELPVNPFAAGNCVVGGGVMALSQVFKATQAPSSPFVHGLPSDTISERPSPDFYVNAHHPINDTSSSPIKTSRNEFHRALTEPQTNYVSMKESQAQRERSRGLYRSSSLNGLVVDEESDEDFDSEESLLRRRRLQRKFDEQARNQFAGLTAPQRPSSSGRDKRKIIPQPQNLHSSQHRRKHLRDRFAVSDNTTVDDDLHNPSEDETEYELEPEDTFREPPIEEEDDKENVNVAGLQVPMTTSFVKTSAEPRQESQQSPSIQRHRQSLIEKQNTDSDILSKTPQDATSVRSSGSTEKIEIIMGGETVAIADSQPSQVQHEPWETQASVPPQTPFISSPLCVPQSQIDLPSSCPPPESAAVRRLLGVDSSPLSRPPTQSSSLTTRSSPHAKRSRMCGHDQVNSDLPTNTTTSSVDLPPAAHVASERERSSPPTPKRHNFVEFSDTSIPADAEISAEGTKEGSLPDEKERRKPIAEATSTIDAEALASTGCHHTDSRMTRIRAAGATTLNSTIPGLSPGGESHRTPPAKKSLERMSNPPLQLLQAGSTSGFDHPVAHSNGTSEFETAQTNFTSLEEMHEARVHENRQPSSSARSMVCPKVTRLRSFADIASPTLPDAIGEQDMDISLLTSQDVEYQAAINGSSPVRPSHKRRRGTRGRPLPVIESEPIKPPQMVPVSSTQDREKEGGRAALNARLRAAFDKDSTQSKSSKSRQGLTNLSDTSSKSEKIAEGRGNAGSSELSEEGRSAANHFDPLAQGQALTSKPSQTTLKPKDIEILVTTRQLASKTESRAESDAALETTLNANVTHPNRIFAHFNGWNAAYYPATCIGVRGTEEPRFRVRFDDGTIDTVGGYGVKRLELRKGDVIKVDIPSMRTKNYVVLNVDDDHESADAGNTSPENGQPATRQTAQNTPTDIRGKTTVQVYLKQRDSLPSDGASSGSQIISVPIIRIYLTQTMWSRFKDRRYTYVPDISPERSGLTTPSEHLSTPSTPSSRYRRVKTSALGQVTIPIDQTEPAHPSSGLFAGMVFAVTYGGKEEGKQQVIDHILDNGGRIVQDGFHELFHIPHLEPVSPTTSHVEPDSPSLRLTPDATELGFACVIADGHSRRKKHLQALALGLPCLAGRWVKDCVAQGRLVNWEPYLLPSGESKFLGGAVRSRMLQPYPAGTARLSSAIENRTKILAGRNVLLVMGRGKAEENRKAYLFLTHALGPSKVSRALDLAAARKMLADSDSTCEKWDLVYVDGKKKDAEKVLFGTAEGGRKRKRRGGDEILSAGHMDRTTRVVGNEFVVQSLILGQLLEDE